MKNQVNSAQPVQRQREFSFDEQHFQHLRRFVSEHTGIVLTDLKKDMVYGRLSKRVRQQFNGSFSAFCQAIDHGDVEQQEFLINAITTNLTGFFREPHHFDFIQRQWLPELRAAQPQQRRLRIWSAGCSTGEEPYSIAISLHEAMPDIADWDIRILATDLDANVLRQAEAAVYTLERVHKLSKQRLKRWFQRGTGVNAGRVRVDSELRRLVYFRRLNLLHDWPMRGPFDLIFCRNVVIYFDKPTQQRLFARYADILSADGVLCIGHSETLHGISRQFRSLGQTIYRRQP